MFAFMLYIFEVNKDLGHKKASKGLFKTYVTKKRMGGASTGCFVGTKDLVLRGITEGREGVKYHPNW